MLDLLVIAPHPDDAEISVGGTILSSLARGLSVGVLDLTSGEPTPHGSVETRRAETARATEVLGLSWRKNLGLPNRNLEANLDARREIANVFREVKPRVLLSPFPKDAHPDHIAASELVNAARFWAKLSKSDLLHDPFFPEQTYHYYSIHLRTIPKPAFVVDVSEHLDRKMEAIRCYESQVLTGRDTEFPTLLDDIRDRSRYWGWSIGKAYAEPFTLSETVGLPTFPEFL